MLNPSTDKFFLEFSGEFFNTTFIEQYNDFLKHKNHPIKELPGHIVESVQNVQIPGMTLNTLIIDGLNNTGLSNPGMFGNLVAPPTVNANYSGTSNINQIIESNIITVTFKNTIINWMYFYQYFRAYYDRNRPVTEFEIRLIVKDAANIDMLMFRFSNSFISGMPGLEFAFNEAFRESKTIDIQFTYSGYNVDFILPGFKKLNVL